MVYAPETQSGSFFNDQEREVSSLQWVEALSLSRDWRGQHVFKVGTDLQRSHFTGFSASRPVEIRRLDGSLAERTVFGARDAAGGRRHRVRACSRRTAGASDSRLTFELGLRLDRDAVVERVELVAARRRGDRRAAGRARHPARRLRQVRAADAAQRRGVPVVRAAHGHALRADGTAARPAGDVRQRPRRRSAHAGSATSATSSGTSGSAGGCCSSSSSCDATARTSTSLTPDPAAGELRLSSTGTSRYRELEATTRYLGGERRDLTRVVRLGARARPI